MGRKVKILNLTTCREQKCMKFIQRIKEGNPIFPLIHDRVVKIMARYESKVTLNLSGQIFSRSTNP